MSIERRGSLEGLSLQYYNCKALEKSGKLKKALQCLEKLKQQCQHKSSEVFFKILRKSVNICNLLFTMNFRNTIFLLKAENLSIYWLNQLKINRIKICEKTIRSIMTTYNNFALLQKSGKKYKIALGYLHKSLELCKEISIKDSDTYQLLAKTYLNISILYFDLGKNQDSLDFANHCLEVLQKELKIRSKKEKISEMSEEESQKFKDMICTYLLSFYSIALVHEAEKNIYLMKNALKNAVEIGSKYLDTNNHIYQTVNLVLKSLENKLIPENSEIIQEKSIKSPLKPRISQLFLSIPSSNITFYNEESNLHRDISNQKLPGRYYSQIELREKEKSLKNPNNINFISADTYFFQEISKSLNIKSDLKYLKLENNIDPKQIIKQETSEKRIISDLRLKKRYRGHIRTSPIPSLDEKLQILKQNDAETTQKQQKKRNLITNSLESKNLIRLICDKNRPKRYPPQSNPHSGLFFQRPILNINYTSGSDFEESFGNDLKTERSLQEKEEIRIRRSSYFQNTKDEIESLIEKVSQEIKEIKTEGTTSKLNTPSGRNSNFSVGKSILHKFDAKEIEDPEKLLKEEPKKKRLKKRKSYRRISDRKLIRKNKL